MRKHSRGVIVIYRNGIGYPELHKKYSNVDEDIVKISAINKLKFTENKGRINDSKIYSLFLTSSGLL